MKTKINLKSMLEDLPPFCDGQNGLPCPQRDPSSSYVSPLSLFSKWRVKVPNHKSSSGKKDYKIGKLQGFSFN